MMGYVIAMAGKGGTGKTTIAALIVRMIKEKNKGSVLAVDADPNATLADWLGIKYNYTVSDIIEETKGLRDLPDGVSKPAHLEYQIQRVLVETAGVDLICLFNNIYFTVKCGYNVSEFPGIGNFINLWEIDTLFIDKLGRDFNRTDD
jgi:Ni2+-binding GTPase involved in maturation of urease and hydrogenase